MHAYLLHNGKIHPSSAILLSPGQVGLMNGWGVFSTIRVIDGVLFAFERHFERMRRDAARMRVPFPGSPAEIEKPLLELVEANRAYQATLRVVVVRNRGGMWEGPAVDRDFDLIAFTTDLKDWGGAAYNLAWLEEAQSRGWDEALLLNERGEVSECTSANVFLCEGNRIWTPPLDSGCLPGVTREILLHELAVPGVSIGERRLTVSDLEAADEVFITSTTRGLLPVSEIEGLAVRRRGEVRNAVQAAFEEYVRAYVARVRSAYHLPAGAR
jgi:branched-subunit amino acid aminotransferase/4-amino-4-deoxychorismate lyase